MGGGGYGLVQWTPQSVLINHCNTLGLSPYNSGDVQIQVIIEEITGSSSVREWYTSSGFIANYYNSGATSDMIGITGSDFFANTMNWNADKLAVLFMAGYERPAYDPNTNHYARRMEFANNWFSYMGGVIPPTPPEPPEPTPGEKKQGKFPWVIYSRKLRNKRNILTKK